MSVKKMQSALPIDFLGSEIVEQHRFMAKFGAYMRNASYDGLLDEYYERFFNLWFHLWPHDDQETKKAVGRRTLQFCQRR